MASIEQREVVRKWRWRAQDQLDVAEVLCCVLPPLALIPGLVYLVDRRVTKARFGNDALWEEELEWQEYWDNL